MGTAQAVGRVTCLRQSARHESSCGPMSCHNSLMSFPKQASATTGRILENTRTKEILQVAASLFDSSGYASTTMHDIGDAAGVLPGSLYHHFASKEDIAVELLASFYTDVEETLAT